VTVTASLSTTDLAVAPGHQAGCDVRVSNSGADAVTVDLTLAGGAVAWAVVLPPSLVVAPGACGRSRLVVDVPRDGDLAGTERGVTVGVRARDAGSSPIELVGRLAIVESLDLRASVTPLVARARGEITYTVAIANHGTRARRVDLGLDGMDQTGLRVRLSPAQLVVVAGEQATADLSVKARRPFLVGRARPRGVVVEARPDAGPPLVAAATHLQEPVRWRPGAAAAAAAAVVAAVLVLARGGDGPVVPAVVAPATSTVARSACPASAADGTTHVDIAGFAFCPAVVTVGVGTEVTWANTDLSPHTVTFDGPDDRSDSDVLSQGQSWSRIFDRAGTYQYSCRLHAGMTGTVVVT
jgi:plastocyanin